MKTLHCAIGLFLAIVLITPFASASDKEAGYKKARERMVSRDIQRRGVSDKRVLAAMAATPRHRFVPEKLRGEAYADNPLPIGEGQTISQPYVVALMTEILGVAEESRVLEIGTGSGYQAAVLARVAGEVYSIEIKEKLHKRSTKILRALAVENVQTRHGDGYFGWEKAAPFDGIMITAAVDHIPPPLLKQLKVGGKLVLPLGNPFSYQNLVRVTKMEKAYKVKQITGVLFVPMTGHALEDQKGN